MAYLITQILIYLVLAAVIGFLMAWVLRGSRLGVRIEALENELWALRQQPARSDGDGTAELAALREQLESARADCERYQEKLAQAQREASASVTPPATAAEPAAVTRLSASPAPSRKRPAAAPKSSRKPSTAAPKPSPAAATEGATEGAGPPADADRPPASEAPSSDADDLKRIKGIGPKIEEILHSLGIHHFHQIAAWTPANMDWVNDHLRFKGRIQREKWIAQAKEMAG